MKQIRAEVEEKRMRLSEDPVTFFEQVVGFKPTSYQRDLAEKFFKNQFTAMRWNRQSGKSWIAAALLLNYAIAHPGSYIGIVAPGWRQSKLVVRRIRWFLRKLPREYCPKPARTVLYFSNGSVQAESWGADVREWMSDRGYFRRNLLPHRDYTFCS